MSKTSEAGEMEQAKHFTCSQLEEVQGLSSLLSGYYPDPARVECGIAELLINAIEHGNAGISYDEKTTLLNENRWEEEVKQRLALPKNKDKLVYVTLECRDEGIFLHITDDGAGFDWEPYVTIDPLRVLDRHGRGIAYASQVSFDSLTYHAGGNRVTAAIYRNAEDPVHTSSM